MGTHEPLSGLAGALFSRVQLRVLSLLIGQPDRSFQVIEVIRLADSGRGAVQRELEKLTRAGILSLSVSGSRKAYQANRKSPIFQELHGLILKTAGLLDPLRKALQPYNDGITAAFVFGSVAEGRDTAASDIDLMIIGNDLAYGEIYGALQKAEAALLRPVNPNLMAPEAWTKKIASHNSFVRSILRKPKLFVLGNENELKRIGQPRQGRPLEARARRPGRAQRPA
jgi:predicted nucleotidyltransferase